MTEYNYKDFLEKHDRDNHKLTVVFLKKAQEGSKVILTNNGEYEVERVVESVMKGAELKLAESNGTIKINKNNGGLVHINGNEKTDIENMTLKV